MIWDVFYDLESSFSCRSFEYFSIIAEFEITYPLSQFILADDIVDPDHCSILFRIDFLEIRIHLAFNVSLDDVLDNLLHVHWNIYELVRGGRCVSHVSVWGKR